MNRASNPDAAMMAAVAALVRRHQLPGWETAAGALDRMAACLSGRDVSAGGQAVTEEAAQAAGLRGCAAMIAVATGVTDRQVLTAVEDLMRTEHSTLGHLDSDRFTALARECLAELWTLAATGRSVVFGAQAFPS